MIDDGDGRAPYLFFALGQMLSERQKDRQIV
jgi:hypothetical protein